LKRFLFAALPLLFALFALFHLGLEIAGYEPELGRLVGGRDGLGLPGGWIVAAWALEALALAALYLLVVGSAPARLSSGLLAAWIAWVFRGPLLVITATGFGGLSAAPWWRLSLRWFVLYSLAGLLLGVLGTLLLRRAPAPRAAAQSPAPPPTSAPPPTPVEPNPPAPRSLDDSSSASSHSTASTRATTS
jgi:hypothetical protein